MTHYAKLTTQKVNIFKKAESIIMVIALVTKTSFTGALLQKGFLMLDKKIAIVTGGRKGIGRAIADALAERDYLVIITGRGETADLGDSSLIYLPCDNSDVASIRRFAEKVWTEYGPVSVLVNNAGTAPKVRLDLLETTEESYDFVMDTNLKGCFFMTQAFASLMEKEKKEHPSFMARIINISSVSAYATSINRGEYCISKAGIAMVTQLFAHRLAEIGIPVFEVQPGIIRTDMTAKVQSSYEARIADGLTPIRRMGEPKDVADCVMVCAEGSLDFATGQVIEAGGGFHIQRL